MSIKIFSTACFSHIGKRENHEDNFYLNGTYLTSANQKQMSDNRYYFASNLAFSKVCLFAVSDGMGGHRAGEVASRICVEKLASVQKDLQRCRSLKDAVAFLQTVIADINNTVCDLSSRDPELKGMGATLVISVICGKECAVLNIGDSRAYYFNSEALVQITKDHTEGQRMLDLGLLTRKELSDFSACKNLNRYIGYGQAGYVLQADEYYPVLGKGLLLLCSDGISDFLDEYRIAEILRSENNLNHAGKKLVSEAVAADNADNATAILIPLRR